MFGIHGYSNRVSWPRYGESVCVDPRPEALSEQANIADPPAPFARPVGNPSPRQAYLFGMHRCCWARTA